MYEDVVLITNVPNYSNVDIMDAYTKHDQEESFLGLLNLGYKRASNYVIFIFLIQTPHCDSPSIIDYIFFTI